MGFAKYLEDITDRYCESSHLHNYIAYLGPAPNQRDVDEARYLFGNPLERPRRLISEFWNYYRREQPQTDISHGQWDVHFQNIKKIHRILLPINQIDQHPDAWSMVKDVQQSLRAFFVDVPEYGPLSRSVFERVHDTSQAIHARSDIVIRELKQFRKDVRALPNEDRGGEDIEEAIRQLDEIRDRLDRDLKKLKFYQLLANEAIGYWNRFLQLYTKLAIQHRYRPALQYLDRFHLTEHQERYVSLDHQGGYRIQGASGSGKTVILIHRALRLASENPTKTLRLFTINRALAELLSSTLVAIHGGVPPNLKVAAFYDFLCDCICLFEPRDRYRLVDERSRERIGASWRDFYEKLSGPDLQQKFIASKLKLRELLQLIELNQVVRLDASSYIREEMIYIQSGYRKQDREQYLTDRRRSRWIPFGQSHKSMSLQVLNAWEAWLRYGHLCDVDGLSVRAATYFETTAHLMRVREAMPTDFVLVDEFQDFSTTELGMVRQLVPDPESSNCFFLVGDLSQKVYPKHHDSRRAGFDFRGRGAILKQNFRNTRQILQAAYSLSQAFPPTADDDGEDEVIDPELSNYEGGRPVVFECTAANQLTRVVEVIKLRRGVRVAVVSENDQLLSDIRRACHRLGFRCHDLLRNEDLDLWRNQADPLAASLVVARLEAVKGFEFDTVIACDLSHGTIPRPGTAEHWRQAAVLYVSLTRARDELIMTYVGKPSRFLKAMLEDVDVHESFDATMLRNALAIV